MNSGITNVRTEVGGGTAVRCKHTVESCQVYPWLGNQRGQFGNEVTNNSCPNQAGKNARIMGLPGSPVSLRINRLSKLLAHQVPSKPSLWWLPKTRRNLVLDSNRFDSHQVAKLVQSLQFPPIS